MSGKSDKLMAVMAEKGIELPPMILKTESSGPSVPAPVSGEGDQ